MNNDQTATQQVPPPAILDRPDGPGWWFFWNARHEEWVVKRITEPAIEAWGKWVRATPPPPLSPSPQPQSASAPDPTRLDRGPGEGETPPVHAYDCWCESCKPATEPMGAVEWVIGRQLVTVEIGRAIKREDALTLARRCEAAEEECRNQWAAAESYVHTIDRLKAKLAAAEKERDEFRRRWHRSRKACRQQGRGMQLQARVMQLQTAETLLVRQQKNEMHADLQAARKERDAARAELAAAREVKP